MRQRHEANRPAPEPVAEAKTTRLGGGLSARLVALGAVVVLGGVIVVAVSGRPPGRDPASRPSFPAAIVPLPTPVEQAPVPQLTPMPTGALDRGRLNQPGLVTVEVQLGPVPEVGGDGIMGRLAFPPQSAPPGPTRVAEPAVPLILLTATPWHTQRANRTYGESWVAGY